MKKNKLIIVLITSILTILLACFFTKDYLGSENKEYDLYNDYSMSMVVRMLTYYKNFDNQYASIRKVLSTSKGYKITKGDLIYDFSNYHIVPILDYMIEVSEKPKLIESFSSFMQFIDYFNVINYKLSEEVFVRQQNGKYFIKDNDAYIYKVSKKIINRETFNKLYVDYLKTQGYTDNKKYFYDKVFSMLTKDYSYKEMVDSINKSYDSFYKKNEDIIIDIIAETLEDFSHYLIDTYMEIDIDKNIFLFKKNIDTEVLNIDYKLIKAERIFNPVSKYYTNRYQLDLDNLWMQTKKGNYPKLYM